MAQRKPKLRRGDLVLVRWLDAAGHRERDEAKPIPCLSVGWLVEIGEKSGQQYAKLASELLTDNEDYDTCEHVAIPEGMVQEIIPIRRRLPKPFHLWTEKTA